MKIEEAIKYIKCVSSLGTLPGLERIEYLLERMNHPEKKIRNIIHVAGTNGKGSFCSMLSSVLRASGYSVGVYTSPHMIKYNERICVNDEQISDEDISRILDDIILISNDMEKKPSEFEILTAIAYKYFAEKNPDYCIVECGMGGRWDATNVIKPILSVITGVSLDHVDYLGSTLDKIAFEKSGIIKDDVPILYGGENYANVLPTIIFEAKKHNSKLFLTNREKISNSSLSIFGSTFDYGKYKNIEISLPGHYQLYNTSNVIEACELLNGLGANISADSMYKGLKNAKWIGRFEVLQNNPLFVFDGGHNQEGVSETVSSIKSIFGDKKITVISGVLKDKDYFSIADMISQIAEYVCTITPNSYRALDSKTYSDLYIERGVKSTSFDDFKQAVLFAVDYAKKNDTPVLCVGSLYTYSDVIEILKGENNQ